MTGIENGRETHAWTQGFDPKNVLVIEPMYTNYSAIHYVMHVIVHDMSGDFVIDWINDIVESCVFC